MTNSNMPLPKLEITAYELAERFLGTAEISGQVHNPQIQAMLKLDASWVQDDETPWCSAFVNYVAWLLRLPRSKHLGARTWLTVGAPIDLGDAVQGFDVVVFTRGGATKDPRVIEAPGHVGFYAGSAGMDIWVLGGNQGDQVSIAPFKLDDLLGVRRLKVR